MADEFRIPAKPVDLLNEDADLSLKVRRLHEFEDAAAVEIEEYAEGASLMHQQSMILYDEHQCCPIACSSFCSSAAQHIRFTAAGALYDICNQDALCIVEQELFDKIYSIIRCTSMLLIDKANLVLTSCYIQQRQHITPSIRWSVISGE